MLAWHLVGALRRWHHQVEAMLPTHNETDAGTTDTSVRCVWPNKALQLTRRGIL
jgi:hypothetical protein